jgi:hypothetical protein
MWQGASSERKGAKSTFAFFKRPRGKLEKEKIRGNFSLKKPKKTRSPKCVKFTKTKNKGRAKKHYSASKIH